MQEQDAAFGRRRCVGLKSTAREKRWATLLQTNVIALRS
jgi:hypothetical protein